ncbi:MAG: hypothetical protein RIQ41_560 [Candidatus Parcubacteria bacterium]
MASNAQERAKQEELNDVERQLASKTLSQTERNVLLQKKMNALEYFTDRDMNAKAAQQQSGVKETPPESPNEKEKVEPKGIDLDFTQPGAIPGVEVQEVSVSQAELERDFSSPLQKMKDVQDKLAAMRKLLEKNAGNTTAQGIIQKRAGELEATLATLNNDTVSSPETTQTPAKFVDTSDPNAFDGDDVLRKRTEREAYSEKFRKSLGIQ